MEFENPNLKLYLGELRGYRYWWAYRGTLFSVSMATVWRTSSIQASCYSHDKGDSPRAGCLCGIYAWYFPSEARRNHREGKYGLKENGPGLVLGVIAASGTIVPGTVGFKAERATVKAVSLTGVHPEDCETCALSAYQGSTDFSYHYPDVELFDTDEELLAKYPPQPLPEGLVRQ